MWIFFDFPLGQVDIQFDLRMIRSLAVNIVDYGKQALLVEESEAIIVMILSL